MIKRLVFALALTGVLLTSCESKKQAPDHKAGADDTRFGHFEQTFIEDFWKTYPGWANSVGYHKYDNILVIPDSAGRQHEIQFTDHYLDSLKQYNTSELSDNNLTDYYLIRNQLLSTRWALDTFKEYQWNPALYNAGDNFALLLSEHYAPLDTRLRSFAAKLSKVPTYYAAVQHNLTQPTLEHTRFAIDQNNGTVEIFTKQLPDTLKKSGLSDTEKQAILKNAEAAAAAIRQYVSWLQAKVDKDGNNPSAWRSFRIGKELYDKKFAYDLQSDYTPVQIYNIALHRKQEIHQEMARRALQLWPKYFGKREKPADTLQMIRRVLDTLAATHATPQDFQPSIERQLPELASFIRRKALLYMDPRKPLVVRRTPDYMAGFSVASINAPGPYDKEANTYYNVDPLDKLSPQAAESHLREYNHYTLQIIDIHEAIPGHYTQLVYSNRSPSLIKSIFGSGNMVEGWAVYTERMMLEEGYGDNSPELWLMYYKWHLRSVCNTLLDYGLQVKNMTETDALHLLRDEAFQEETEARGKYKRASLSQVQLCSYFTGFTEIYNLREEIKKKEGKNFSLKAFHEKFLSYGSAPVKYIRMLMLKDMKEQGQ